MLLDNQRMACPGDSLSCALIPQKMFYLFEELSLPSKAGVINSVLKQNLLPVVLTSGQKQSPTRHRFEYSTIQIVPNRQVDHDFRPRIDFRNFLLKVIALLVELELPFQFLDYSAPLATGSEELADECNVQVASGS